MIKAEKFDLKQLSEEDIISLERACMLEISERNASQFPYKVGDCFCDAVPGSSGKGWQIVRINGLDLGVNFTMISVDLLGNTNKFDSKYGYKHFVEEFKTPIDPKIFELYSENFKAIQELKNQFTKQMFNLRKS